MRRTLQLACLMVLGSGLALAQDSQPTSQPGEDGAEATTQPTTQATTQASPPDEVPLMDLSMPGHAQTMTCDQNAQSLDGGPTTSFRVVCPVGCTGATVWGTDVYTDDSAICVAAIHAGLHTDQGGQLLVVIEEGQSAYPSSYRNRIQSQNWRRWHRSFRLAPAF